MKNPTFKKLRAAGFVPIRYHTGGFHSCHRSGWIVDEGPRGSMTIRLIGDERNRRISAADQQWVTRL